MNNILEKSNSLKVKPSASKCATSLSFSREDTASRAGIRPFAPRSNCAAAIANELEPPIVREMKSMRKFLAHL